MQLLSLFPECQIAITTKDDGGIVSEAQLSNLLVQGGAKLRGLILPSHQHAAGIMEVELPLSEAHKTLSVDGLMTDERLLGLSHRVADCCPIVVLDRRKKVLACLHAGWRGMTLGVVGLGVLSLASRYRSNLADLWMWIGPSIQKDSYVTPDVPVQSQFLPWKKHIHTREDGFHIDLPGFAFAEAVSRGIPASHIISDSRDTFTEREVFFSHRRAVAEQNIGDDQRFAVTAWLV